MASWEGVVFLFRLGVAGGRREAGLGRLHLLVVCSCSSSFCFCCWFFFLLMLFHLFVRLASVIFIMVVWSEIVCPSAELRVSVIWLSISLVLSPETEQTWW